MKMEVIITMATLRKRIIMYRAKHNMSQVQFAKHAGISEATLVYIETGKKKKLSRLVEAKIQLALEDENGGAENESV